MLTTYVCGAEAVVELLQVFTSFGDMLSSLFSIAIYVLSSLSLYTIAQRRSIHNPWLAWLPIGNLWILGCISDQYRYVALGQEKSKRKVLLVLNIIAMVLAIVIIALAVVAIVNIFQRAPSISLTVEQMQAIEALPTDEQAVAYLEMMINSLTADEGLLNDLLGYAIWAGMAVVLISGVSLAMTVLEYMAYYDLFASCEPSNAKLYLVVGILFTLSLPVFLFISRNKDLGMPARQAQTVVDTPVYEE